MFLIEIKPDSQYSKKDQTIIFWCRKRFKNLKRTKNCKPENSKKSAVSLETALRRDAYHSP